MHHRQDAQYSPRSPEIGQNGLAVKTISDGTKLPVVAQPSQHHNLWYELPVGNLNR
jgi:hypothetical protein